MADKVNTEKTGKGSEKAPIKKKSKSMGRWIFLFAILLILTLMIFAVVKYLFLGKEAPLTMPEIHQKYTYPNSIPKTIAESELFNGQLVENDIFQAQEAFEAEQFSLAIKHYNKAMASHPNRFDLKLYAALTHIQLGKDDLAQQLLYKIIEDPDKSLYASDALWYSALIDLKNNNIVACKESLKKLIDKKTSRGEVLKKAVQLQEELDLY